MGLFDSIFGKSASTDALDAAAMGAQAGSSIGHVAQAQIGGLTTTTVSLPQGMTASSSSLPSLSGYMTPAQVQQALQQLGIQGLTKEQADELAELRTQHAAEIKGAKVNEFKKLPPELRQFVINVFSWKDSVKGINELVVNKSDRLLELERLESSNGLFGISSAGQLTLGGISGQTFTITSGSSSWFQTALTQLELPLPDGITIDELRNAHMEATLEEELLDEAIE